MSKGTSTDSYVHSRWTCSLVAEEAGGWSVESNGGYLSFVVYCKSQSLVTTVNTTLQYYI